MSEIKIVIPSHKRPTDVRTKKIIPSAIICVPKNQKEQYKYYNQEMEILDHPDDIIGISKKRQWIYKKFGDVVMCDDDILKFVRVYYTKEEQKRLPNKLTIDEVWLLIQDLYNICKENDIKLFGLNNSSNPAVYTGGEPVNIGCFVTGGFFGLLKDDRLFFPDIEYFVGEDDFINCINAYYNRICYVDKRFAPCYYKTEANQGGCATFRTTERRKESVEYLQKYFGDAIVNKKPCNKKINKLNLMYETQINIPFW